MPECSNPVQCQLAKRELCTCACGGANHGVLRKMMDNPETREDAELQLTELRKHQAELKKQKRIERRKKRAEAKKVPPVDVQHNT